MVGLALGTIYADTLSAAAGTDKPAEPGIPGWLLKLSLAVAGIFLVLRYSPVDHWIDPNVYGWLIDKWHLGPARVINFSALAIILARFGTRIGALPGLPSLAILGRASIEVFCVHILCCFIGDALSKDADPQLPCWQQTILLVGTLAALFLTGLAHRQWIQRRKAARLATA
jgi:hypothetical protein